MSKYTTEIRFICEQQSGLEDSVGYNDVGNVIANSRAKIFDFDYPCFDNSYKPSLETKILMHYYTREISEETYGLWKLRLRARLNEIMPYYNKLYQSELIEFNPLWDTDMTIDRKINVDNTHEDETNRDDITKRTGNDLSTMGGSDTNSSATNDKLNTWDLYSDTPQGSIKGIQGAEDSPSLGDNGYLTNARHTIGDTSGSTSSGTTNYGRTNRIDYNNNIDYDGKTVSDGTYQTDTDWLEKITGYRGRSPVDSIMKLRESFLNIDMMVIRELADLFFNLW